MWNIPNVKYRPFIYLFTFFKVGSAPNVEPNTGLELTTLRPELGLRVGCLTYWATHVPHVHYFKFLFKTLCRPNKTCLWVAKSLCRPLASTSRRTLCGARSQDPGIMTWAEGRCLTDWATQASLSCRFFYFLKDFISLFDRETASERGNTIRGSGRGRSRLPAEEPDVGRGARCRQRSPTWDSIP